MGKVHVPPILPWDKKNGHEFLMYFILNEKKSTFWNLKKLNSKAKSNTKMQELKCSIHP